MVQKVNHKKHILVMLLISLFIATSVKLYTGRLQQMHGDTDVNQLLATQYRINDPELYKNDKYFNIFYKYYPNTTNFIIAKFMVLFGRKATYLIFNYSLLIVFLMGLYFLGYTIFRNRTTALILAVISSYGHNAVNGALFGIQLGQVITRYFVFALVPFIVLFFLRNHENELKVVALFFIVGLLANVHLLSIFYLAAILFVLFFMIILKEKKSFRSLVLSVVVFLIGATPVIINFLRTRGSSVPLYIIQYRMPYLFDFPLILIVLHIAPPLAIAYLGYRIKKKMKKDIMLKNFFMLAVVLSVGGIILSLILKFLLPFQFFRAASYACLPVLVYVAYKIHILFRGEFKEKVIAVVLLLILVIPIGAVAENFVPVLKKAKISFRGKNELDDIDKKIAVDIESDWESFYDLTEWAKTTPKDTVFLVFPKGASVFRAYSQRAIVVSHKDGSNIILSSGENAVQWYNDYKEIALLYTTNSAADFKSTAKKYNVSYIVVDKNKNPLSLPVSYENEKYFAYSIY